jgi:hypothetical protein
MAQRTRRTARDKPHTKGTWKRLGGGRKRGFNLSAKDRTGPGRRSEAGPYYPYQAFDPGSVKAKAPTLSQCRILRQLSKALRGAELKTPPVY